MRAVSGDAAAASVRCGQGDRGLLLVVLLVSLLLCAWLALPERAYGIHAGGEVACNQCHQPHQATLSPSLLDVGDDSITTQVGICMFCHEDGALGAPDAPVSDINTSTVEPAVFPSGHRVESASSGGDLTNDCSGCHNPHTETVKLPQMTINGFTVLIDDDPGTTDEPNTWCRACHDPESDDADASGLTPDANWAQAVMGYPEPWDPDLYYDQIFSSREVDTYIGFGTFRGWTAYENTSAHASIPASSTVGRAEGDCLWCHERHSSTSTYDNLIAEFGPTSKAACDECHEDHLALDPAGDWGTGHFIDDAASPLNGLPLPCYECHNAHGSRNGNTMLGQDSLGQLLNPDSESTTYTVETQAQFCYTCHLSSDGLGWNSWTGTMQTYAQLVTAAETSDITTSVAGLLRTDMVQLPARIKAHQSSEIDKLGCKCHGSVHAPNPKGVPAGGQSCYNCHPYEASMEYDGDDRPLSYHHVLGTSSTPGDNAFASGSYPGAGTTPLSDTEVYCLSCHVDHDKFYDGTSVDDRGSNLRAAISSENPSDTDFDATTDGICLGCHDVARKKDTANQKSADGTDYTPAIDPGLYGTSAHGVKADGTTMYTVQSASFGTSTTFQANCSKCHNDNRTRDFYDEASSAPMFGLHWSPSRRILAALGRADYASDPSNEEDFCYSCHSPGDDTLYKAEVNSGKDWYGTPDVLMSTSAEGVYTQFTDNNVVSRSHRVSNASWTGTHSPSWRDETGDVAGVTRFTAGEHIECADCHSPHGAGTGTVSGTKRSTTAAPSNLIDSSTSPLSGVWGVSVDYDYDGDGDKDEWVEPFYSVEETSAAEYQICLKCHSGFNEGYNVDPGYLDPDYSTGNWSSGTFSSSWPTAAAWTNVALEFNPANDSYHPVFATAKRPLRATQLMKEPWNSHKGNQTMYCSDCHYDSAASPVAMGPHGSATTRILRGNWDPESNAVGYRLNSTGGLLCAECHTNLATSSVAHLNHANRGYSCGKCHIAIPHGGAAPRLLATTGTNGGKATPAPYNAGTQLVNFYLSPTTGIGGSGRNNATCQATSSPTNCGGHNGTAQTMYWDW